MKNLYKLSTLIMLLALFGTLFREVYQTNCVLADELNTNQSLISENADWQPQDYYDSQGIAAVQWEAGKLNLTANLTGGDINREKGEVWLDLRYFPGLEDQVPINMSQRTITVEAEVPTEFVGWLSIPNGLQVFAKEDDEDWTPQYGTWVNVNQSGKYEATLTPTTTPSFNAERIIIIGAKFAIGHGSLDTFAGQLNVTNITVNPPLELTPPPPLPESAPVPRFAAGDAISVESDGFYLNGRKWFVVGGNFRGLPYGQSFGVTNWFVWGNGASRHPNFIRTNFNYFRRAGAKVIRVELLADGRAMFDMEGHVVGHNERFREDLKTFLDLAYEEGIKVEFTLLDYLIAGKAEIVKGVWLRGRDAIIANETLKTEFINEFLRPFLEEFGDHPALIGFDLMNEPEWIISQEDGGDWEHADNETKPIEPVPIESWKSFIADGIGIIRTYAPGKLVTVGVSIKFMALVEDLNLDYFAFHHYPWMGNLSDYVPSIPTGKPWSLEEYPTHNTSISITEYLNFTLDAGGAGALLWNLSPAIDDFAFAHAERDAKLLEINSWVTAHESLDLDKVTGWHWTSDTTINAVASGDVDSDEQNEIVTGGCYYEGTRTVAQLVVWNGTDLAVKRLTTWYWTGNTTIDSVALGDVDGDGQVEIVTGGYYFDGTRKVAQLVVWTGSSLAVKRLTCWYWHGDTIIDSVVVGDVDADAQVEIVTGGCFFDGSRDVAQLVVWTGSNLTVDRLTSWYWTGKTYIHSVALGDVDGDSQVEVVTGGSYFDGARDVAQLVEWNGLNLEVDRLTTWYWTNNTVINSVAIGDMDNDSLVEIATGGYYNDGARNVAQLVEWTGSGLEVDRLTGWYWTGDTAINSIAVGDVDADGQMEVVTGGYYFDGVHYNSQMVVWNGSDLSVWNSKTWYWTGDTVINSVVAGDVDGDFSTEIVTGGAYHDITLLNSQLCVWGIVQDCVYTYKIYGLDFGPYTKEGQNPDLGTVITEAQIRELLTAIKPYAKWVRTFGCTNGLEVVGRVAHEFGLKAAVGAWLSTNLTANEIEISSLISIGNAGEADMLIVGSEVLLNESLTEAQLIEYINRVKAAVPGIPVATADVYGELLAHPAVMAAGDVVLPNYYPYWEGVNVTYAVALVNVRHRQVVAAAGGKPVIVSESGWPSSGNQIGDAVPSPENAAYYFLNFESWARAENVSAFYFEAFDEPWKASVEGPQGAHWGVWDKDGNLKPGMRDVFDGKAVADNWSGDDIVGGSGNASIEFTYVPPYGSFDNLRGQVLHVKPADYRVAVYIKVGSGWWTKPTFDDPLTIVYPDGSWVCDVTTGGADQTATEFAAYLISVGYDPSPGTGQSTLPAELDEQAVAKCHITRAP